jgi:hypothetical protein
MKTKNLLLGIAIGMGFSLATVAQNVPNNVPTNGLVGWWPFNGNANDESGNGNNGTVNGATLTADRFGNANKAYSFDGVDDYVISNGGNQYLTANLTISFWVNYENVQAYTGTILALGSQSSCTWGPYYNDFQPGIGNGSGIGCGGQYNGVSSNLNSNNWYNIIIAVIGNTNNVYLNGNYIGNNNNSSGLGCSSSNLYFGVDIFSVAEFFNGKLDDIGIWNRALTQQEISDLYNGNICYQHITVTDTLIINTNLVGFNPVTYQNSIKIFPNPTNDHITINYGNYATLNNYQLRITNSLGQQMFQTTINQQSSYINLSNWTGNGIYFVHLIDPQGNTIDIRKIVLQ